MAITRFQILIGSDTIEKNWSVSAAQVPVQIYWEISPDVSPSDIDRIRWKIYWYEWVPPADTRKKTYDGGYMAPDTRSGTATVPKNLMDISKITKIYDIPGAGLVIEYYNRQDEIIETDERTFEIYGKISEGDAGSVDWDMTIRGAPDTSAYTLTGESLALNTNMTGYSNATSGTPIIAYSYNNVWGLWRIRRGGTDYTLQEAVTEGIIPDIPATHIEVRHAPDMIISALYTADMTLVAGLQKSGEYYFNIEYVYKWKGHLPGVAYVSSVWTNRFTIYDRFAGAAFHIASITAAQYKQGDPDPLHGMPPYTVTLADDTVRQEYTIPLESIQIDWDDPYSDSPAWTISNPGTSAITIPPHVYTDTNTHIIRMTCVDKRGTTYTAEVSFSPSKQPRIILPPTLNGKAAGSTISMAYPALMTGTAYNAGSPDPETEWSYVLQGSSAGYYSGSKVGDYAEFSLLAAGTYTVAARISDDTIILGTYTWTVKVGAEPVSTAQDMPMEDFSLWVLDGETPVDVCRQHTCPQYTRNFQGLDTVSFEIPEKYPYAKHLQEGDRFLFGFGGAARLMQVTYRRINAGIISIAGQTAFPDRVAVFATRSASDGGYDIQKCSAEAIIRYFIFTAAAPDPYTSTPRAVDIMMHGTNRDLPTGGEPVTYSARYDNILDIVTSICKTSGLGFSVAVRNTNRQNMTNSTQVHIIEGTNRTYSTGGTSAVLFSENLKNCRIESEQSAQTPTVAVVAGAGTGQYRQHTYYDADGNNNPSITGYQRRESFVDAGESADAAEQKRIAMLELREAKAVTVDIEVLPTAQYELGRDYDVGDIVSVWLDSRGGITDLQIYAADVVDRDTGREIHLHLGSRVLTAPALIAAGQRKNTYARK